MLPWPTLAFEPELSAHQFHELRGNRQAQSRAAILARHRAIGLLKSIEDHVLLLGGMPMPVSVTAKRSCDLVLAACLDLGMKHHLAMLGELDGVADEIEDDLAQATRVAHQRVRDIGPDVAGQFESFLLGTQRQASSSVSSRCRGGRTRWSRGRASAPRSWRSPGCR